MDDSWSFRTERGRARVADGHLRIENSLAGMARKQWIERRTKGRLLFLFTTLTTLWTGRQVAQAGRALAAGSAEPWHGLMLVAFAFVALVLLKRTLWSKALPLRRIQSIRRVDDECVRVTYAESDDAAGTAGTADFDIETPTEDDADEAVEMLRLKGVRVGDGSDADAESKSLTFRERLSKKVE